MMRYRSAITPALTTSRSANISPSVRLSAPRRAENIIQHLEAVQALRTPSDGHIKGWGIPLKVYCRHSAMLAKKMPYLHKVRKTQL